MTGKGVTVTVPGGGSFDIVSLTPPGPSAEPIDMTHLGTSGNALVFDEADFYDGGELTLTVLFDPSEPIMVNEKASTIINFVPVSTTWTFDGIVTNYEPGEVTYNQRAEATITIKVSGEITIT